MKTCMFTGMFRNDTFDAAVINAAKLGYDAIEIRYLPPHFPEDISAGELRERGRKIAGLGLAVAELYTFLGNFSTISDADCEKQLNAFPRLLEACALLGGNMVKIGCGGPNAFLAKPWHFEKSAYWLARLAGLAGEAGVRVALEIHNGSLIEDIGHALSLLEMAGQSNLGLIHDAGNMYITGEDFGEESVLRMGPHLFHVHIKDVIRAADSTEPGTFANLTPRGNELFRLTPLGQGETNHLPLLRALYRAGYTGYLSAEANLPMDARTMAAHELAELTRLLRLAEREDGE